MKISVEDFCEAQQETICDACGQPFDKTNGVICEDGVTLCDWCVEACGRW